MLRATTSFSCFKPLAYLLLGSMSLAGAGCGQMSMAGDQQLPNKDEDQLKNLTTIILDNGVPKLNNGLFIVDGDIAVSAPKELTPSLSTSLLGLGRLSRRWPDRVIPYRFDSMPSAARTRILDAMSAWRDASGITFRDASQCTYAPNYVNIQPLAPCTGAGCPGGLSEGVGMKGGVQQVWLPTDPPLGTILHELGHVIGLYHEHNRPDRDSYIIIDWSNVPSSWISVFDIYATEIPIIAYDDTSIMQYPSFTPTANNPLVPWLTRKDGSTIPFATALSSRDASGTTYLYNIVSGVPPEFTNDCRCVPKKDCSGCGKFSDGCGGTYWCNCTGNGAKCCSDGSCGWSGQSCVGGTCRSRPCR